jgi:YNFM family putative membrane transporter
LILSKNLLIALCATAATFCTLYTPQPMLPLLAQQFSISSSDAGLLMTATLLPLGLAPIFYGYFLQAIPAKLMLTIALVLLSIDQMAFYFATEFWHLVTLRAIQGLLLPAIFTALMTYCSSMSVEGQVRKTMGFYIGATILGGYAGRVIAGYFASYYEWYTAYMVLGFLLLIPITLIAFAKSDAEINFQRLDVRSISRVLANRNYRYIYLALMSLFFAYAGVLNLIPFRLYELNPSISPLSISNLYIGYLIGIPVALYSVTLLKLAQNERKGLMLALAITSFGFLAYFFTDTSILFVSMFFFASGFFFIHSTLAGLVNHLASEHKGVVNGLYVSIYYLSGALASWLPGVIYDNCGWTPIMIVFTLCLMSCAWFLSRLRLETN